MPQLTNKTPLSAQVVPLIDREGHNVAVVIAKATFDIEPNGQLRLSRRQVPVSLVDEPVGTEPRIPADLTDFKMATDVIVVAPVNCESQRALNGRTIGISTGSLQVAKKVEGKWPFGPLPRDKEPRRSYAGTYDEAWTRRRMPLLPVDFDPRFNSAAPPDQLVPTYLRGDEKVVVARLYGGGSLTFNLPGRAVVVSGNVLQEQFTALAKLDTMLVWADAPRMTLVWRHAIRPRQKIEEVSNIYIHLTRLKNARELYEIP